MKFKVFIIILIALVVAAVAAGAGYFIFTEQSPQEMLQEDIQEPVACTQEALVCPDGSSVGRSGPDCTLGTCPDTSPYTGVLQRTGNGGFELEMEPPDEIVGTGAYSLPIELRVSNTVGQFIGREVTISGNFVEGNAFQVTELEPVEELTTEQGSLAVEETMTINGLDVTLDAITQDSRCPSDATCIQAGGVTVRITVGTGDTAETTTIATNDNYYHYNNFVVSIVSVAPEKASGTELGQDAYSVTFEVAR